MRKLKIVYLVILAGFFLWYPGQNRLTMLASSAGQAPASLPFLIPAPAPYPTNVTGVYPGAEVTAGGVVIEDVSKHL
ncbi:MAG: hypothetical protein UW37_C0044G0004 [Candidatus Gottesmanbacteria bacterium GW2011_GWA2_44_17]|uniref:Uncharacterized protein n=1 Tax=Candidatus Gottesmanbacteria bacterium GW2011_GWA2_44_17 TaxID=1618444 RepID=A0A0G1HE22_9BACT|nr:MAG: hypothetical protein UW37_C0044G0004 [Candidatus Gottesmanbacteria bacterium GW2011_GWA2_44_17]